MNFREKAKETYELIVDCMNVNLGHFNKFHKTTPGKGEIEHLEGCEDALNQMMPVPEIYPLGTTGKFTDRMGNLYEKK